MTFLIVLNKKLEASYMYQKGRCVEEYYGKENLKEIFTQILKQEFIKDYEDKTLKGWKNNEKK